jgi:hypothetical protein
MIFPLNLDGGVFEANFCLVYTPLETSLDTWSTKDNIKVNKWTGVIGAYF